MNFAGIPWGDAETDGRTSLHLVERLAEACGSAESLDDVLRAVLPELLVETSATTGAFLTRQPEWQSLVAHRHFELKAAPLPLLEEAFDRESAVWERSATTKSIAVPVQLAEGFVVLLQGDRITERALPILAAFGRAAQLLLPAVHQRESLSLRLKRLRTILQAARVFAEEKETQPLLEKMAEEATKLHNCERASIFIWDRDQKLLVACPALGVSGGRLWLPDNKGIVGEVVKSAKTIRVDDAYEDSRFDQSVDKKSGYRTRNLLCVPMLDGSGQCLGAFELINKVGGAFSHEDEETLEDLCVQAAIAVLNARERDQLVRSNQQLTEQVAGGVAIIGDSPAIAALRGTIDRLAATDLPVLILGESGTGKEVAAHSLHYRGTRAEHPFVAVNCAALTETLLESELFGHEKGAFTDAQATHIGKFELAEGGTLFLDEIGDMSPGGQAKLLRVLEQKVITRVGGSVSIPINVRVIAATNANLAEKVREKLFRQDLYYRLSVVTVEIPALRDRPEDVLPLATYFLQRFCKQANRVRLDMSTEARRRLQGHGWPGNVRELRNLMERVAFLAAGPRIESEDLPFINAPEQCSLDDLSEGVGLMEASTRFQQEYIRRAIKRVQGNMSEAARLLGLHRSNLYRKMRQLDMPTDEPRT